jgi:hypothetical protein
MSWLYWQNCLSLGNPMLKPLSIAVDLNCFFVVFIFLNVEIPLTWKWKPHSDERMNNNISFEACG